MTEASVRRLSAVPQAGQKIIHEGKEYTTIKEGLAHILVPHGTPTSTDPKLSKEDTQRQQVFYNPIQQFNRDLSVLAIKTFGEDLLQRRRQKYELGRQRLEKRKQKSGQNGVSAEPRNGHHSTVDDPNVNLQENDTPTGPVEVNPKKRKSKDEDGEQAESTAKRQRISKSVENVDGLEANLNHHMEPKQDDSKPHWIPSFSILDALSATGLRALRYAHEIPFATAITANDMSSSAVQSITLNVRHNQLESRITAHTGNAIAYMYSFCDRKGFDVIDLDPYGTAAPFIDSAIQAINDEGLLCVTCTDSAIFASHGYLEKTYSQYGGLPLKGTPCHEGGLRLILHAIATSAGRYGMSIEPLLSLSIDYYIRVFVRVRKAPSEVKLLAGKTMIVYHCDNGCGAWTTQFLARNKEVPNKKGDSVFKHSFALGPSADAHCQHCGFKTHLSGPMYGGPLHNTGYIERILAQLSQVDPTTYPTADRIEGMLHTALDEILLGKKVSRSDNGAVKTQVLDPIIPKMRPADIDDHPFFFIPSAIAKVLHCSAPPSAAIRGALRRAGFRVAMSHCKPGTIKTDASWSDIWHIMLQWVRQRAPLKNPLRDGTPGKAIMAKSKWAPTTDARTVDPVQNVQPVTDSAQESESKTTSDPTVDASPLGIGKVPKYLDKDFEVHFDEDLGRDYDRGKYVRYQLAPRENWGPMARAK